MRLKGERKWVCSGCRATKTERDKEKARRWYLKNKEALRLKSIEYRKAHAEEIKKRERAAYYRRKTEDPEKFAEKRREYARRHYAKYRERLAAEELARKRKKRAEKEAAAHLAALQGEAND